MKRSLIERLEQTEGAEIAEAALVLPLVFMFLLGIVWFGRAFNIYSTITQAAQRGAITAARPTCATCGAPGGNWMGTNFPGDTAVLAAVHSVTDPSNLDRNSITGDTPSPAPAFCTEPPPTPAGACTASTSPVTVCRLVWLNNPSTPQQCGVIVRFQYPFQFFLPFTSLSLQQVNMTAEAQVRMEN